MHVEKKSPIGRVARASARARELFEQLKVDYYERSEEPLDRACANAGADVALVIQELAAVGDENGHWRAGPCELVDHVEHEHHSELRARLQRTRALVLAAFGADSPVREAFSVLAREVERHFETSHRVFARVRAMHRFRAGQGPLPEGANGSLAAELHGLRDGNERIAAGLRGLSAAREVVDGDPSAAQAWSELDALATRLHETMHFETNVLIPEAACLEAEPSGIC